MNIGQLKLGEGGACGETAVNAAHEAAQDVAWTAFHQALAVCHQASGAVFPMHAARDLPAHVLPYFVWGGTLLSSDILVDGHSGFAKEAASNALANSSAAACISLE